MNLRNAPQLVLLFFLLPSLILVANPVEARADEPNPKDLSVFKGKELPKPPQQNKKWRGSSKGVSAALTSASEALFNQGLADPRGCEYRSLELKVESSHNAWVHGWLILGARETNDSTRFAVAWNGLVYPIVNIGDPANMRSDITEALKLTRQRISASTSTDNTSTPRIRLDPSSEQADVSETTIRPIKACLLLRLGENELANQILPGTTSHYPSFNSKKLTPDLYLTLAEDWAWSLFKRAANGHVEGDDQLSFLDASFLMELRPKVEQEAKRRGYIQSWSSKVPRHLEPYLKFLDQLPYLYADEERRVSQRQRSLHPEGETEDQRIAELIEDLDQVAARQFSYPGGNHLEQDPRIVALIKVGEPAIEPLLKTLEEDKRLTRSVWSHRSFSRNRVLIRVSTAAYVALTEIIGIPFEVALENDGSKWGSSQYRRALVKGLRDYHAAQKEITVKERL